MKKIVITSKKGFALIELIVVIVILSILAAVAVPKFTDLRREAKIAVLDGIAGSMRSAALLTKSKARVSGLSPVSANPGGNRQPGYLVDFPFGSAEVDWRNLCPESRAESGDRLTMLDFLEINGDDITNQVNNQYTLVGYDIPGFSVPTDRGCYVIYDSFGNPDCTVVVVSVDC